MKNLLKLALFFLVVGTIFFSCDKNGTGDEGDKDPVVSGKSCPLKSIDDNGEVTTFYYNSEDQVTQILTPADEGLALLFKWENGKVVAIDIESDNSDIENVNYILEYDNSGKIVKGSTNGIDGETGESILIDIVYHYDGNRIKSVDFLTTIQELHTKTIKEYTYKDGNIILMEVTLEVNGGIFSSTTSTYQYDNKKNPYRDLGIEDSFGVIAGERALFASKNNYTKLIRKDRLGNVIKDESLVNTFVYNSDGYPINVTDESGSSSIVYFECK